MSSCNEDETCQMIFNLISGLKTTTSNPNPDNTSSTSRISYMSSRLDLFSMARAYTNSTAPGIKLEELCRCVSLSYECEIEREKEKHTIESDIVKNIYLILYIILILTAFGVNLLTAILIIKDHKNYETLKHIKNFFLCKNQKIKVKNPKNNLLNTKLNTQIATLNSMSDILIVSLLLSYFIITLYVIPNQTYLFYANANITGSNCRISEFFKAFSVTLSIYSLVALSLQRLFAIKFTMFGNILLNNRLYDSLSFVSVWGFIRSVGFILHTFFCSRFYRRYLITSILILAIWAISITIGVYNMSQYHDESLILKNYDFYERNMSCVFSPNLQSSTVYCSTKNEKKEDETVSKADLIFLIVLLVIPNIIVTLSYSWVCFHVWTHGNKINMSVFRSYMRQSRKEENNQSPKQLTMSSNKKNEIAPENSSSGVDIMANGIKMIQTQTPILKQIEKVEELNDIIKIQENPLVEEIQADKPKTSSKSQSESSCNNLDKIIINTTNPPVSESNNAVFQNYQQFSIKKRNMSVTLTTLLMVICFSVCWTPFFIFPIFHSKIGDTNTYNNIKVIIHLIGYSSSIWNPVILIIKSNRFKVQLRNLLVCCRLCIFKSHRYDDEDDETKKRKFNKRLVIHQDKTSTSTVKLRANI